MNTVCPALVSVLTTKAYILPEHIYNNPCLSTLPRENRNEILILIVTRKVLYGNMHSADLMLMLIT